MRLFFSAFLADFCCCFSLVSLFLVSFRSCSNLFFNARSSSIVRFILIMRSTILFSVPSCLPHFFITAGHPRTWSRVSSGAPFVEGFLAIFSFGFVRAALASSLRWIGCCVFRHSFPLSVSKCLLLYFMFIIIFYHLGVCCIACFTFYFLFAASRYFVFCSPGGHSGVLRGAETT